MTVLAIGLHHSTTPASVLGTLAISADVMPKALMELTNSAYVNEAAVISTCNRTEVYVDAERFHDAYHDVRDALAVISGASVDDFVDHLVVRYHDEAVEHLFRVAAGLDSAILGEHEVLGQVKTAWESARLEGSSGPVLDPLFQHAVIAGKKVRTDTDIGRHTASLSHAAVTLISEHRELTGTRVLLVGAGEAGSGIATALAKSADVELVVVNRTRERADRVVEDMARVDLRARAEEFDDLAAHVAEADIVVTATAAPEVVIDLAHLEGSVPGRAKLLLDLAVPADIAFEVAGHPDCDLLGLPDLQELANRGLERRQAEAESALVVVDECLSKYHHAISAREVDPLLGSLHRWGEQVRTAEVERYRSRLGDLDEAQLDAIEGMTKAVVAKLLHQPSAELRQAAGSPRGERLAEAVRELFDQQ